MWSIGLDVHSRQSTYCVLDEDGKRQKTRTVRGHWEKVLLELAAVQNPFAICYEASTGYGALYDRLRKIAARVAVAHPGHLRLIFRSKRKSDRVDAEKLAKLLYLDEVPLVHVPAAAVRSWRSMIEYRQRVLGTQTRLKNQLRALVRGQGLVAPKGLWSRTGIAWLREQSFETPWDGVRRDDLLEQLADVRQRLKKVTRTLDDFGKQHAGVVLLRTIPGVGPRTAEAVLAYVDDVRRFPRVKCLASYFGLIPCQDQSAATNRLGHITRQGPGTVRKLLTEAAWRGIRKSPTLKAYFERIRGDDKDRRKIALIATAHYLVRVMYRMLWTGECWRHDEPTKTAADAGREAAQAEPKIVRAAPAKRQRQPRGRRPLQRIPA